MNILTINVGSSSIKYAIYKNKRRVHKDQIERIGVKKGLTYHKGFDLLFKDLRSKGVEEKDIDAIAHRVVHAGTIQDHIKITPKVINAIKKASELAPLHDIPELKGIALCKRIPCQQFALLDTAFHKTIPKEAALYPLPKSCTKKFNIKRYGFHGLSHQHIAEQVKAKKLITCHLGNGASITAIQNGKSIDTSMGFTPLEGLMMGSRSGDVDPGMILYLMHHTKLNYKDMTDLLNRKSGLKGICGKSDMRDIIRSKSKETKLAVDMFCYRIAKYIGSYTAAMDGVNAIVFTAGIGENEWMCREKVCRYLSHLGVKLDKAKNKANKRLISKGKVKVYVIPTDEESVMVNETMRLLKRKA